MKTITNHFKELRAASLGMVAALTMTLNAPGQTTATTDPVLCIARAATYLVTAPLTMSQAQSLNAQNFYQLPPSLRPLYLHAAAFQIGAIVAVGEALPASALAEYLQTADPDEFFDVFLMPSEDEALIKDALREVNALIANEIAANAAYQRAIRSGAVNAYTFPGSGGTGSLLTPSTESLNNLDDWNEIYGAGGGTGSLVDDILQGL